MLEDSGPPIQMHQSLTAAEAARFDRLWGRVREVHAKLTSYRAAREYRLALNAFVAAWAELDYGRSERVVDPPEIVIAEWRVNHRQRQRVMLKSAALTGSPESYLDVRNWFVGEGGDLCPGRQGVAVSVKYLPILTPAVIKAREIAVAQNLIRDNVEPLDRGCR
jgi:hypothetical protein